MIPHTLVLKPGLVIHSIYNGYWFRGRPSITDLWHDLRAVTREIRPDWDLSAPGLRAAWNAGDHSPFTAGTGRPEDGPSPPHDPSWGRRTTATSRPPARTVLRRGYRRAATGGSVSS
jgi:hypothetical protein